MTGRASDFFEALTGVRDEVELAILDAGSLGALDFWQATEKAASSRDTTNDAKLKFLFFFVILLFS
jgi:hypothetical protein